MFHFKSDTPDQINYIFDSEINHCIFTIITFLKIVVTDLVTGKEKTH